MDERTENKTKIEHIMNRIKSEPALSIARIPKKTLIEFIDFAKTDFCDDRGMALKWLMDVYTGIITTGVEHIEIELNLLHSKIEELERKLNSTEQQEEKPKKKRLGVVKK